MGTPFKTFAFYTLGCKLNFSESSFLANQLDSHGYSQVSFNQIADIYIINTCSVTENADKKANRLIKKLNDRSPNAFVIVTGCYAQLKPNEIKKIDGVDLVLENDKKFDLVKHIIQDNESSDKSNNLDSFNIAYSSGSRTRSYLKIQDGCDYNCSYCTIPMARGKSRSGTIDEIINATNEIYDKDIKEIVLTGVNIGDYRNNDNNFFDLLERIESISNVPRFRISSIEPNLLTEKMIDFILSSEKFNSHFHIPLQSGSNKILNDMQRRYNASLYSDRVGYIREKSNYACIGSDVIVGFPTESDYLFNETKEFIENLDINYLHVFPYSDRERANAKLIKNKVRNSDIKQRSKILRLISDKKNSVFINKNFNKKHIVLFESYDGKYNSGFTENYIKVNIEGSPDLVNSLHSIQIKEVINGDVYGDFSS